MWWFTWLSACLFSGIVAALKEGSQSRVGLPNSRPFLPLPGLAELTPTSLTLRVQQFNVLADGLSGKREDLGKFARVSKDVLKWESRRESLLHEIAQYDADVVTLQECDHFHDFFQPKMYELGYVGYFAPKPTSGCLDVSENADGCAMFIKRNKFRVLSCEAKSLALSIAKLKEGELDEDETSISQQNQVAIIAVLEFIEYDSKNNERVVKPKVYNPDQYESLFEESSTNGLWREEGRNQAPPLIVGTAHLKSSKTSTGERYRQKALLKILTEIERISITLSNLGRQPAVLFTGDLNADATPSLDESKKFSIQSTYAPLTWNAAKMHRLALRSVYHDDILSLVNYKSPSSAPGDAPGWTPVLPRMRPEEVYTTWKYRSPKPGQILSESKERMYNAKDRVVKRHIDYIFYIPFKRVPRSPLAFTSNNGNKNGIGSTSVATRSPDQIVISVLLRLAVYTFGGIIPFVAIIDSGLNPIEKAVVSLFSVVGLLVFEASSQGTIFRPEIEEESVIEEIYKEVRPGGEKFAAQSTTGQYITAGRQTRKDILLKVRRFSKLIQTSNSFGRPGLQPIAILDLFGPEDVQEGKDLLPNARYPSDHLSLAADFELKWEKQN